MEAMSPRLQYCQLTVVFFSSRVTLGLLVVSSDSPRFHSVGKLSGSQCELLHNLPNSLDMKALGGPYREYLIINDF